MKLYIKNKFINRIINKIRCMEIHMYIKNINNMQFKFLWLDFQNILQY